MASLPRRCQLQESLQTFVFRAMDRKKIQAGGAVRIMKALYKPGGNERIQGFSDQLHIAPHKSGDLSAGQECARMYVQENQQIEIAAVSDYRSTSQQPLNLFPIIAFVGRCRNNSLQSYAAEDDADS